MRDGQLVGDPNRGIRTVTLDFLTTGTATAPGLGGVVVGIDPVERDERDQARRRAVAVDDAHRGLYVVECGERTGEGIHCGGEFTCVFARGVKE